MRTKTATILGVLSTLSIAAGPVSAAAATAERPLDCLDLNRIDHTHVVDDQTILFYTRSHRIYLNHLSSRAPGLDRNQPFLHRTSIDRACRNDMITVLENWGFGFSEGASTTLGDFEPIDTARAKALENGQVGFDQNETVEVK
jgi:hypothetical protein